MRLIAFPSRGVFLGALWACLTDAALVLAALVCWADAAAPPQDLPWKPLRLSEPPGLATRYQLERAVADPARCRAALRAGGVGFSESPPRRESGCSQLDAVRLRSGTTPLAPAAPVMTCRQALTYAAWDRYGLQPAARELLGEPIASVDHMGTYACRNMYGRSDGPRSQHAFANALDVGGFTTAEGRKLRVLGQFDGDDRKGAFLRRARDEACRWFHVTLSPDYNAAHRDHLHLDTGPYLRCR
ncbi:MULTISPECIES: extensin family protein [unclassified Phenylobacterium]|uniref:extensin-like domain-containing protein n=1 Tax=unclassified Phenylobacterium TaxID=2640670 RepID=UPI000A798D58|nr:MULTISPECIES: extensin family protein [unclassified Phenylobacterium]